MTWTIKKLLDWTEGYLSEKDIESPRLDAELLLSHSLRLERIQLYTQFDQPLKENELQEFKSLIKRRAAREPLAYILGEKEFYSLAFKVTPAVLIPRPETEGLVERGLGHLSQIQDRALRLLDLATGSGCILLALLKNLPSAVGTGVDVSSQALQVAGENSRIHGLEERVHWLTCDLKQVWPESLQGPFDLITANLPYVTFSVWEGLAPEVRDHEPRSALVPGPGGLEMFQEVLPQIPSRLAVGGIALLEIGDGQGEEILKMASELCPEKTLQVHQDLSGLDRVLEIKKLR